jgi:hypothetical protein
MSLLSVPESPFVLRNAGNNPAHLWDLRLALRSDNKELCRLPSKTANALILVVAIFLIPSSLWCKSGYVKEKMV